MEVYNMRLPEGAIKELNAIASRAYMPPRTLIRTWVLQRLDAERMNENPAVGVEVGTTSPTTGTQRTSQEMAVHGTGI